MRNVLRAMILAGAAPIVVIACNGVLGIDAPNVVDDAAVDASGGGDAPSLPDGDAGTSSPDGSMSMDASLTDSGNLLYNGEFEKSGCDGWNGDQLTLTRVAIPHSGTYSCLVCSSGQSTYGIRQLIPVSKLTVGMTYDVEAWLHAPPAGHPTSGNMLLAVDINTGAFSTNLYMNEAPAPKLDATWQRATNPTTFDGPDGGTMFEVQVLNRALDNGCFLVDDVSVRPHPL